MSNLNFSLAEIIAYVGLIQAIYVLVFMFLRLNRIRRTSIPILFFITIFFAFLFSASENRLHEGFGYYSNMKWFTWTCLSPLSVLLIIQTAKIIDAPVRRFMAIFILIPLAFIAAKTMGNIFSNTDLWLYLGSVFVGCISLLSLWQVRYLFEELSFRKKGRERYWLIVSMIAMNITLIAISMMSINSELLIENIEMVRNVIGIAFVYIVSTSLFRVFPQTMVIESVLSEGQQQVYLTEDDIKIALKIENLLHLDKVYQEPNYKRSDLARELLISDAQLSKIVNNYFEKSVPQLLNTYRVEDSKYLLKETEADIATISEEAGFNSIATFNRVFKEITDMSPSEFRDKYA